MSENLKQNAKIKSFLDEIKSVVCSNKWLLVRDLLTITFLSLALTCLSHLDGFSNYVTEKLILFSDWLICFYENKLILGLMCFSLFAFLIYFLKSIWLFLKSHFLNLILIIASIVFFVLSIFFPANKILHICLMFIFFMILYLKTKISLLLAEYQLGKETHWDAPLKNPENDKLGRKNFAENIFKIIEKLPATNHRFAITGEWGTGKSTILNFIERCAEKADYPVVKFNPWEFDNKKDMWQGFVAEIDNGLSGLQGSSYGLFAGKRFLRFLLPVIKKLIGRVSYGDLFNDLFLSRMEGSLDETKEDVAVRLKQKLKNRKLLIFIDDLDRAQPQIVYQVLVLIKEIIDVKGCVFVCAIDEKQTINILRKNFNFSDPKLFLDKIFHICFPLITPLYQNKSDLIDSVLEKLTGKVKKDIILKFINDLPDNPRIIKKYLTYLSYLYDFLKTRFDDDEIEWNLVYYAEMLKHKFPGKFEPLLRCDLSKYLYSVNNADGIKNLDEILNEVYNDDSIKNEIKKIFIEVKRLFRVRKGDFLSFENYFDILSAQKIMTNKKYREWRELSKHKIVSQKLKNVAVTNNEKCAYLLKFLKERVKIFVQRGVTFDKNVIMNEISKNTDEFKFYVQEIEIGTILDDKTLAEIFVFLYDSYSIWKNIKPEISMKEKEIAKILADKTLNFAEEMISSLYENISPTKLYFDRQLVNKSFYEGFWNDIEAVYKNKIKEKILNEFSQRDGFWRLYDSFACKELLFKKNDYLYSKDSEFLKLIQSANTNNEVFVNYINFIYDLFAHLDHGKREIVLDDNLREFFWQIIIELSEMTVPNLDSLLEARRNVMQALNRNDILPIPPWVEKK